MSSVALCTADDPDAAERLAGQAGDASLVDELRALVTAARERLALGELSVFERSFVSSGDQRLRNAVLHPVKVENDSANVIKALAEALVFEQSTIERVRLLSEFLPAFTAPLRTLHGTREITRLIEEVERLDQSFLDAAEIVRKGAAPR